MIKTQTWTDVVNQTRLANTRRTLLKLLINATDEDSAMAALNVNAQYAFRNVITLPAALITSPFFDPTFPR